MKPIKPTHKAVKNYYERLKGFDRQNVSHEGAVRAAFQTLLSDTARVRAWTLITELPDTARGKTIVPDGTLRDSFHISRGHWEAKDTDDDLDAEIAKKIAKGYPTTNTIFEDTRHAVLFQDKAEVLRADLSKPKELVNLLTAFYTHVEPDIDHFEKAVEEFKLRVPELARGLLQKIEEAKKDNDPFIAAFKDFFALCQTSLNPNISPAAVDEMLVQHLLTRRLFSTIFDNPDFIHRNVIAAEVEKVIDALAGKSFSLRDFLKTLDRFYVAIEEAARGLTDFSEKQHFLNTVYEEFFQGYSVKVADTLGIVYTPQPIVDFMCASVEEVLKEEFGKSLGSEDVHILDPCTGTGNFIVNLLRRIPKRDLPRIYREQLFANEVMLMPYYISALNIEHAYYELTGEYEPFEGLCFVDSLDLAEHKQSELGFMTERNTERVERQKGAPITVIIGNPPYNVGQINENDNNKNRKYEVVEKRIRETYARDSTASNKNKLSDAYVKFFRWAVDRLGERDGIVCFVSNNGFIDQIAFDGMRKHLGQDFTNIYHIDLHGNVRKNPKLSGTTHNVFGIQVGVGVTVAVRNRSRKKLNICYHRVPEFWRKEEKLNWLLRKGNIHGLNSRARDGRWRRLVPDPSHSWLVPDNWEEFQSLVRIGSKESKAAEERDVECVFKTFSAGVNTARDKVVYDFDRKSLIQRVKAFIEDYNSEVDRWKRSSKKANVDDFVRYDKIKWSRDLKLDLRRENHGEYGPEKVRTSLHRPFCQKILFFDRILNEEVYVLPRIFPSPKQERENKVVIVPSVGGRSFWWALISNCIPNLGVTSIDINQCFPYYTYDEDGTNRRENITDWALNQFRQQYKDRKISKRDIFHYVYGLLHHPSYREKYADCLKKALPRIPYAPDFRAFAKAGKELGHWHLNYEDVDPYELEYQTAKDIPLSYGVEDKMRLSKDKTELKVNPSLTLAGIPPETFEYRLGNRSALEWVIDQYRVKTDKRSGIKSDPNRKDDPEYIVRLVGRVINVSLETVRIVDGLAKDFGG